MPTTKTTKAIEDGMSEVIEAEKAETKAPAKKRKAPAKAKAQNAKTSTKAKTEEKAEPPKPEPVTYKGLEIAEGVNPSDIEAMEKEAHEAFSSITNKDSDLLPAYMTVGKFMVRCAAMFKSTKLFGQYRRDNMPESEAFDPALRTNCGWLFRAINDPDHEGYDVLTVLGLDDKGNSPEARLEALKAYKSTNPTVIKRHWRDAKDKAEKLAKAKEVLGSDMDDMTEEQALDNLKKKQREESEADFNEVLSIALDSLSNYINKGNPTKAEMVEKMQTIARKLIEKGSKDDKLAYLNTL